MNKEMMLSAIERLAAAQPNAPEGLPALRIVDDKDLAWGRGDEPDVLLPEVDTDTAGGGLASVTGQVDALLASYYRTHPLTRTGFNSQVVRHFATHGASSFVAAPGALPACTLFVDGGEVVVETAGTPRHRYGAYCTLDRPVSNRESVERAVQRWVESGEAYDYYLSTNVCRYNC